MTHAPSKPTVEKNCPELRLAIARRAGTRTTDSCGLDKNTLNSVYAYLTGEFYLPRYTYHRPEHPEFVSRKKVLYAVAHEAEVDTLGADVAEDEDVESDWARPLEAAPRELRRADLYDLLTEMKQRDDQREWTG